MRIALEEDGDENTILYLSEQGLKAGAKEELKGKKASYLFPYGKIIGCTFAELGVNPDCIPIVVIPDTEFDEKFGEQAEEDEYNEV